MREEIIKDETFNIVLTPTKYKPDLSMYLLDYTMHKPDLILLFLI